MWRFHFSFSALQMKINEEFQHLNCFLLTQILESKISSMSEHEDEITTQLRQKLSETKRALNNLMK
jgi:hypothetical protein